MTQQSYAPASPAERRERGVRLFQDNRGDDTSGSNGLGDRLDAQNAAYNAIAPKPGCSPDSLRVWCQQAERDTGRRPRQTS